MFKKMSLPFQLFLILISVGLFGNLLIVAFFSYFVGKALLPLLAVQIDPTVVVATQSMQPLFGIKLPCLLSSFTAMLGAIICGISLSFYPIPVIENGIRKLKSLIETIINSLFIPILPFYVLGFLLEINHQGVFMQLFQTTAYPRRNLARTGKG